MDLKKHLQNALVEGAKQRAEAQKQGSEVERMVETIIAGLPAVIAKITKDTPRWMPLCRVSSDDLVGVGMAKRLSALLLEQGIILTDDFAKHGCESPRPDGKKGWYLDVRSLLAATERAQ